MEYEINVARPYEMMSYTNYFHYFKVVVPYGNVKEVYDILKDKFPDCKIEVTAWQKIGQAVDMDECNF